MVRCFIWDCTWLPNNCFYIMSKKMHVVLQDPVSQVLGLRWFGAMVIRISKVGEVEDKKACFLVSGERLVWETLSWHILILPCDWITQTFPKSECKAALLGGNCQDFSLCVSWCVNETYGVTSSILCSPFFPLPRRFCFLFMVCPRR